MAQGRPKGKKRTDKAESKRGAAKRDAPKGGTGKGEGDEEYEFPMPDFDEAAFMRREVEGARMSFITLGLGIAAGILARIFAGLGVDWKLGWVPILAVMLLLRPMFVKLGYSEENTSPKSMVGNYFLAFFTSLALWVLLYNEPFASWY